MNFLTFSHPDIHFPDTKVIVTGLEMGSRHIIPRLTTNRNLLSRWRTLTSHSLLLALFTSLTTYPALSIAELLVFPVPDKCHECIVPSNLGLPQCTSPNTFDCYCELWSAPPTTSDIPTGTYITPILECAQSHCSAVDVDNLLQYYSALCVPPTLLSGTPGKKPQAPFTGLLSTHTQGNKDESGVLSSTCTSCFTTFQQDSSHQCTLSDLSSWMCSPNEPALHCPYTRSEDPKLLFMQVEREREERKRLSSLAGTQLLACIRGPSCSRQDKVLLTRWSEGMCPEDSFTTLGVLPEEGFRKMEERGPQVNTLWENTRLEMKRDRLGSFSEWGEADEQENTTYTGVAAVHRVRVLLLETWFVVVVVVVVVGGALGGGL